MVHNLSLYRKILKGIFTASASIIVTNSFMINRYYHYRPSSSSSTIRINNNNNNQKLYYSSSTINEWREKQYRYMYNHGTLFGYFATYFFRY